MNSLRGFVVGGLAIAIGVLGFARATGQGAHGQHGAPAPPASPGGGEHAGHAPSGASALPSGYAGVMLDPSRLAPIGLTTAKIAEREFLKTIRTVGVVALDETRTAHVHAKVKGFVEALPANFIGMSIKPGQVLCAVYSQAVYAAELEYISLLKTPPLSIGGDPEVSDAEAKAWARVQGAARRRLLLWDVPKAQIDRLEKTLEPQRTYAIGAPRGGTLVAKQAVLGNYVEPGTELFTISDLSNLWVLADVYDADLSSVSLGQSAKLTIEGVADPIVAKLSFLSPTIDQATRTLKVRFALSNTAGLLRPGAFVTAVMDIPLGRGLAVPEDAVVSTGTRRIVFVVHDNHVTPREITAGALVAGHYRVLAGLASGDEVATGAQFLLDSESRLKATTAPGGHGGH